MLRRLLYTLFGVCLLGQAAVAQVAVTGAGAATAGLAYVGPIDIVASPAALYSLRAGSAAIAAAGTQSIVDLRRASDNATCTAKVATNGSVDLTVGTPCNSNTQTVTSWLGSAATCTGAIGPASTTITVTSCSVGSLTVGALITGTGVSANTYVTAVVGGCTAVSSCTVSVSQTAGSTTLTAAPSVPLVSKIYCQPTGGSCPDVSQGTAANQPQLVLNSPPLIRLSGTNFLSSAALGSTISQPFSVSYVAKRTAATTNYNGFLGSSTSAVQIGFSNSANLALLFAGSVATLAATENVTHSIQDLVNGATSLINADGTSSGSVSAGSGTLASGATIIVGGSGAGTTNPFFGDGYELGIWSADKSSSFGALQTNQKAYYGTP